MQLLLRTIVATALSLATVAPANAMTMRVIKDQAILTGPVVPGDVADFEKLLAANPDVKTVVLGISGRRVRRESRLDKTH